MSTVSAQDSRPVQIRGVLIRTAIGGAIVFAILWFAFRNQPGLAEAFARVRFHPHAPDLSVLLQASPAIQIHFATVMLALLIGVYQLSGPKGVTLHRVLGWGWVVLMVVTAVSAFFIREVNHGALSPIHLLAGWTLIAAPLGLAFARRHNVRRHSRTMYGLFFGGLILAGLLAFMPGRIMWRMFFG